MQLESRSLAAGALVVILLILPAAAADTGGHDQIIYISSYGPSYIWNQEMEAGIEAAIADSEHTRIQFSIEYLDAKTIDDTTHFENLYQTFAHKYKTASPDVIIISDDAALLFMDEYGDRLFPGVPVVFTGINNASNLPDGEEDTPYYIGTLEILPVQETIDSIRKITRRRIPSTSSLTIPMPAAPSVHRLTNRPPDVQRPYPIFIRRQVLTSMPSVQTSLTCRIPQLF